MALSGRDLMMLRSRQAKEFRERGKNMTPNAMDKRNIDILRAAIASNERVLDPRGAGERAENNRRFERQQKAQQKRNAYPKMYQEID